MKCHSGGCVIYIPRHVCCLSNCAEMKTGRWDVSSILSPPILSQFFFNSSGRWDCGLSSTDISQSSERVSTQLYKRHAVCHCRTVNICLLHTPQDPFLISFRRGSQVQYILNFSTDYPGECVSHITSWLRHLCVHIRSSYLHICIIKFSITTNIIHAVGVLFLDIA